MFQGERFRTVRDVRLQGLGVGGFRALGSGGNPKP